MKAGWEYRKLGEVCDVIGGGTPAKDNDLFYLKGTIPWATVRDMKSDVISNTEFKITAEAVKGSSTNIIPKGSIVIATRVGLGKVCLLAQDTAINQDLKGVIPKNPGKLMVSYLFQWFKNSTQIIIDEGTGATVQGVKLPFIKSLIIPIPPIKEQQRIVGILDKAFESIATAKANAEKNLQNARALFESHLQAVFSQRGEGWVEELLCSFCDVKHGFAFDGADFSANLPKELPIIITPGNFMEDATLAFNEKNTKRFTGTVPTGLEFDVGDLVVVMTDLSSKMKILGKPAFIESKGVLHNQRIGRFVFLKDRVEKRLLYYFMQTEVYLNFIRETATGTMVKHTAPKRILANSMPFPVDRIKQRTIVSKLDVLIVETQRLESIYQQKLAALDALKKSLLDQAFRGEL